MATAQIGDLRRATAGQAQGEARREVRQHLLIGLGGGMVGFIDDEIVEGVRQEAVQVQRHALYAGANHLGVGLLVIFHVQPQRRLRPELAEGVGCLGDQVLGVGDVKRPPAHALRVADSSHGLAGAGGVVDQRDGLLPLAHLLKRIQCLLLMLLQLERAAPLGRQVVRNGAELRLAAQEDAQLVLHALRLLLHDPHRPTIHRPAHVDHAVLLRQVVVVLHLRHVSRQVAGVVVDLYRHAPPAILQQEIRKPAVLVDVEEGVLRIQKPRLLCTEHVLKKGDEQIFGG